MIFSVTRHLVYKGCETAETVPFDGSKMFMNDEVAMCQHVSFHFFGIDVPMSIIATNNAEKPCLGYTMSAIKI